MSQGEGEGGTGPGGRVEAVVARDPGVTTALQLFLLQRLLAQGPGRRRGSSAQAGCAPEPMHSPGLCGQASPCDAVDAKYVF